MVIVDADALHIGVDDGRADKPEAALLQILAYSNGKIRDRRGVFHSLQMVVNDLAVTEVPDVSVKASVFLLDLQECLCIGNC